jgi:molybdate-binding protein
LSLQEERYDFVAPLSRLNRKAVQAFRQLLSEAVTRQALTAKGFRFD